MFGLPRFVTLIVVAAVSASCVDSTKVGLSNARNENRSERVGRTPDVIANGDDSCERPESVRPDPTPIRSIACPGEGSAIHRLATRD
jgi:hypothetical protein